MRLQIEKFYNNTLKVTVMSVSVKQERQEHNKNDMWNKTKSQESMIHSPSWSSEN